MSEAHNKDSFHLVLPLSLSLASLILGEAGRHVVRTLKQHRESTNHVKEPSWKQISLPPLRPSQLLFFFGRAVQHGEP